MQEAIAQLGYALGHLANVQERLNSAEQSTLVIMARTLTAIARAVAKNARGRLQEEEEEPCEKS